MQQTWFRAKRQSANLRYERAQRVTSMMIKKKEERGWKKEEGGKRKDPDGAAC
jgi:hypothetical protein